jgi:hypothetical protein
MSGRQSLAEAFTPVTPARGAKLEGLLAPRRGKGTQAPERTAPQEPVQEPAVKVAVEAPVDTVSQVVQEAEDAQEPAAAPVVAPAPAGVASEPVENEPAKPKPEGEPNLAPEAAPRPSARQAPAAKPAQKASETVPGGLRNVGVYLPPPLLSDVKDAVYRDRTTYADLLIDAFESVANEQIASQFATETVLTSSGMPRRAPRRRGEAGIQIQLRLDGVQIAWLDEKVQEFDAPSRSALVSAVFKLHLDQTTAPDAG